MTEFAASRGWRTAKPCSTRSTKPPSSSTISCAPTCTRPSACDRARTKGWSPDEAARSAGWRHALFDVAIEEMGHLAAVWNITSALGGSPRFGRDELPDRSGLLPAGMVVKLAPFNAQTLQHFIYLERPAGSDERDSEAFAVERRYVRGSEVAAAHADGPRLRHRRQLLHHARARPARAGRAAAAKARVLRRSGAAALAADFDSRGAKPVICLKTALAAFESIVMQGEGAPRD